LISAAELEQLRAERDKYYKLLEMMASTTNGSVWHEWTGLAAEAIGWVFCDGADGWMDPDEHDADCSACRAAARADMDDDER
jgi:hypothetical protein